MELRKEYRDIANAYGHGLSTLARSQIELTALACQELADRPPRELTDDECRNLYSEMVKASGTQPEIVRAWISSYIAKQREPATVKLRVATSKTTGEVYAFKATNILHNDWEWLDADGKAQEFEVRI